MQWRDGRLYISDFYTHRVLAVAMDGTHQRLTSYINREIRYRLSLNRLGGIDGRPVRARTADLYRVKVAL